MYCCKLNSFSVWIWKINQSLSQTIWCIVAKFKCWLVCMSPTALPMHGTHASSYRQIVWCSRQKNKWQHRNFQNSQRQRWGGVGWDGSWTAVICQHEIFPCLETDAPFLDKTEAVNCECSTNNHGLSTPNTQTTLTKDLLSCASLGHHSFASVSRNLRGFCWAKPSGSSPTFHREQSRTKLIVVPS